MSSTVPTVVFHHLAAREYRRAYAWYRRRSPTAAERFRDEVDRAVKQIADAPLQGAVFRGPLRWMRMRRFPYLLFYEAVDPSLIRIYAVAHGRRRLGYWLRRKFQE
jgi:plasmid stabilization system protein ParE